MDFYLTEVKAGAANNLRGTGFVQDHQTDTKFALSPGEKGMLQPELKHTDISMLDILVSFKNMFISIPI